jgi:hypothetical protein
MEQQLRVKETTKRELNKTQKYPGRRDKTRLQTLFPVCRKEQVFTWNGWTMCHRDHKCSITAPPPAPPSAAARANRSAPQSPPTAAGTLKLLTNFASAYPLRSPQPPSTESSCSRCPRLPACRNRFLFLRQTLSLRPTPLCPRESRPATPCGRARLRGTTAARRTAARAWVAPARATAHGAPSGGPAAAWGAAAAAAASSPAALPTEAWGWAPAWQVAEAWVWAWVAVSVEAWVWAWGPPSPR